MLRSHSGSVNSDRQPHKQQDGASSSVSLISVGEECDSGGGRSEEEAAVLSIMDTTLHLPEGVKHNDSEYTSVLYNAWI